MFFSKFFKIILILILALFSTQVLAEEIKIVHFSDIHLDTINPDNNVRKFSQSLNMFKKAIMKANLLNPDIVIISGDMVNRPKESEFDIFLNTANGLNQKYYPCLGNHDVGVGGGFSKAMFVKKINNACPWQHLTKPYYYIIQGDYIFIFMDGTTDKQIVSTGFFTDEVLNFLDKTLTDNPYKKAIIVQHFPLMPPFKSSSHEIINRDKYFEVIDKHNNIIMVLNGHYHASKAVVRKNVLYVSTPSMIEYPHAFRYLVVDSNKTTVTIKSELIMDKAQNEKEMTAGVYSKLKLGSKEDNYFTVNLINTTPQNTTPFYQFSLPLLKTN